MRLRFEGWARSHGQWIIAEHDLEAIDIGKRGAKFTKNSPVLWIDTNSAGVVEDVTLNCFADVRLSGDYKVMITISKGEIARLFYLTHRPEVDALVNALPIPRRRP